MVRDTGINAIGLAGQCGALIQRSERSTRCVINFYIGFARVI